MYFEGCRPTTCTVLLKGAGLELLKKLKPVVGFAVLTAWNQRLESSFLSDLLTTSVASAGEEGAGEGMRGRGCEHSPAVPQQSLKQRTCAQRVFCCALAFATLLCWDSFPGHQHLIYEIVLKSVKRHEASRGLCCRAHLQNLGVRTETPHRIRFRLLRSPVASSKLNFPPGTL